MTRQEEEEFRKGISPLNSKGLIEYIVSQIKYKEKMEESYSEKIVVLQEEMLSERKLYSKLLDKYIDLQGRLIHETNRISSTD